ncbi:MAG: chitobiase/beta-hexosaminidase C-terminal domain-containing protein, partial [Methylococcales bacterium]|nr:chitobiase/beta-hexosaminidase C-terminal domain-containing protein [Methylococcales bacterium]
KEGRDGGKRTPYNLAISKDEGLTWEKIKTIESDPDGWYCYSAIEFVDNHLLVGHCAGDTKTNNGLSTIQITRLSLDWIYKKATPEPYVLSELKGEITLSCKNKNAKIRYTLDGSLPTLNSGLLYQNPITVTNLMPLTMQAYSENRTPSKILFLQIGSQVFQSSQKTDKKLEQGLLYTYFEGKFNHTKQLKENKKVTSGVIAQFSIDKTTIPENFGYIYEGYIKIPKDGLYTFNLESNDGSALFINDIMVIDNDGSHGANLVSVSTSLRAGFHKIGVNYFQLGGGKLLNVSWKSKDFLKQNIPKDILFH